MISKNFHFWFKLTRIIKYTNWQDDKAFNSVCKSMGSSGTVRTEMKVHWHSATAHEIIDIRWPFNFNIISRKYCEDINSTK